MYSYFYIIVCGIVLGRCQ